jgi:hypothetical protein
MWETRELEEAQDILFQEVPTAKQVARERMVIRFDEESLFTELRRETFSVTEYCTRRPASTGDTDTGDSSVLGSNAPVTVRRSQWL